MVHMVFGVVLAALAGIGSAQAGELLGEWRTAPDSKGQTGDVRIVPCGAGFCGSIFRAHDEAGTEIVTKNVGRQILFGFAANGSGGYDGEVYVPLMAAKFPATVEVSGNAMRMRACNGVGICRSQTWSRLP